MYLFSIYFARSGSRARRTSLLPSEAEGTTTVGWFLVLLLPRCLALPPCLSLGPLRRHHQCSTMATPIQWAAAVQGGRELWAKLQERLAHPQDSDCGGLLVEKEYEINWMQGGAWLPRDSEFPFHPNKDGHMGDYSFVQVQCKGTLHSPYQNALNGNDGVLVCVYNFKDQDFTPKPSMILWTTIIGQLWEQHAADPSNLSLIWRYQIVNTTTQDLINVALQNGEKKTEFAPSDEQFFALLANDNGRGVVHLLRHWCRTLGRKMITKIVVLRLREPAMCFVLEPTSTEPAEPPETQNSSPSKQRKKHGRHTSLGGAGGSPAKKSRHGRNSSM
jgi:hypothetical protein